MGESLYAYCVRIGRQELLAEWDAVRNGELHPRQLSYGSKKKVWWVCAAGHSWQATVKSRCEGSRCPVCTGKRLLPGVNDLASVNPTLAAEWCLEKKW